MKILLTPNALKGSLSASQFITIASKTLAPKHRVRAFILSDGGDGFIDFFKRLHPQAKTVFLIAKNAFLKNKRTSFLWMPDSKTAIIETARICGLGNAKPSELDPLGASSFGVGQAILRAANLGAKTIYVGLGGVACNDGGAGMAAALGAALHNKIGRSLSLGAKPLLKIHHIDLSAVKKQLKGVKIIGVADVTNPLLGPKSSAKVFGPQKGATSAQVKILDKAMTRWAQVIKKETGINLSSLPSTAAAGAIAAGLAGCLNAKLLLGSEFLLQKTPLIREIKSADLVITCEGKLDVQTFYGKAPLAVLKAAKKLKKPVLFICGQLDEKSLRRQSVQPTQIAVLTDFAANINDAKKHAARYVRRVLKNI